MSPTTKDTKNMFLITMCLICLGIISCGGLVDRITPANLPKKSAEYLKIPQKDFCTLYDLKEIRNDTIILHRNTQVTFLRLVQDDEVAFQDAITFIQTSIADSQTLQNTIIGSEDKPFSVLGILAGFTGGAALGRSFKRKGDLSPAEVDEKIAQAKADVQNVYINTKNGNGNGNGTKDSNNTTTTSA